MSFIQCGSLGKTLHCYCLGLPVPGLRPDKIQAVFLRSKRANRFLVEEILQGNLERECFEELCNYEEAREVFEDTAKTISFWTVYYDGDQCISSPCLNGGLCTDKVGGFSCSCPAPYHGPACEKGGLSTDEKYKFRGHELSVHQVTAPGLTIS
uniref:Coagulation factor IXa heavy chain n=1 Tax=Oryzias latipes TaxID=8090 RepID=H2L6P0_ORYLA